MDPPSRKSSLRNEGGVAGVLEAAKQEMLAKLTEKLMLRIKQGRSNLGEEEVEAISRIAAQLTREICANAVGEAFQMGVNSRVRAEEYERETTRPSITEKK